MRRVRITGLVREANRLRQLMTAPMTAQQRDTLAGHLDRSIRQVDHLLAQHGGSPAHLPPQSRRAYAYLKSIDLGSIQLTEAVAGVPAPSAESVSFRGLRAFLDRVLDDIATNIHTGRFNADSMCAVIGRTRDRLDHAVTRDGLGPEHLKPQTRDLLGWFRYFAEPGGFASYVDGVRRAQAGLLEGGRNARWQLPLLVHFRPSRHLYRWQVAAHGTRIVLNTPSLAFGDDILRELGRQMRGERTHRVPITEAMLSDEYQSLAIELEAAGGIVEWTRGVIYDLVTVFDRVNAEHFDRSIKRPRLTWNRMLTGRKFGHYDFVRDTVMISSTLDQQHVPPFVIEHVMHHELLHKKHGFRWHGARRQAHTPEFRLEEKTFPQYEEADRFLAQLCRGGT
jgi:hypothetical protein